MKEDLISNNFITDDNFFGDTPFGETNEKEILRAGSALDESVYKESDASKITIDEEKDDAIERASISKSTLGIYFYYTLSDIIYHSIILWRQKLFDSGWGVVTSAVVTFVVLSAGVLLFSTTFSFQFGVKVPKQANMDKAETAQVTLSPPNSLQQIPKFGNT